MKLVARSNLPCWYELSFQPEDKPAILIKMHEGMCMDNSSYERLVPRLMEDHQLKDFEPSFEKGFGFDGVMRRLGNVDGFTEFEVAIPRFLVPTKKKCRRCKGSGEEEFSDMGCIDCSGTGKQQTRDFHAVAAVSATFTLLFYLLNGMKPEKVEDGGKVQLLSVETMSIPEMDGSHVSGSYSPSLVNWLSSFRAGTPIPEMERAMLIAYERMMGISELYDISSFRACVDYAGGWLNVSIPGNGCGTNPSPAGSASEWKGQGYDFSGHNVDTAMQQITLLAGIAALHDRARRSSNSFRP